jgi:gliding motility-associated-like protein
VDSCKGIVGTNNFSTGAETFRWSFGDGTASTTKVQPSHQYKQSGTYTVKLVINAGTSCADSFSRTIKLDFPKAGFSYALDTCRFFVNFKDSSVGDNLFRTWYFGHRGDFSYEKDPGFDFGAPGVYDVALVVRDAKGCLDTMRKFITLKQTDSVRFTYKTDPCTRTATFTNRSNFAHSYQWIFGDGQVSSLSNTIHTYRDTGFYTVFLIANPGSRCADTIKKLIHLSDRPKAAFKYEIDSCTGILSFQNLSTNASHFSWNFGDSTYSTDVNPGHPYASAGSYTVRLVADSGSICADTAVTQIDLPRGSATGQIKTYNVFTPNGDGKNDVFRIDGLMHCQDYELYIFNRWGQELYHKVGNDPEWNGNFQGSPMAPGTYYFMIGHNNKAIIRGTINLVR